MNTLTLVTSLHEKTNTKLNEVANSFKKKLISDLFIKNELTLFRMCLYSAENKTYFNFYLLNYLFSINNKLVTTLIFDSKNNLIGYKAINKDIPYDNLIKISSSNEMIYDISDLILEDKIKFISLISTLILM